jgi:hypothetical protein
MTDSDSTTDSSDRSIQPGMKIGDYKILSVLGETWCDAPCSVSLRSFNARASCAVCHDIREFSARVLVTDNI